MGQPGEKTYCVVLVPSDQVTADGCKPGFVKLTGTPGKGSWDEWGPYVCAAEVTGVAFAAVTGREIPGGGVPSEP